MSTQPELTRQQLDPVGTLDGRPLIIGFAVLALGYALFTTVRSLEHIANPLLAALAISALAFACAIALVETSPQRAPFTSGAHLSVHLLVLTAAGLSHASQAGANDFIQDDWAALALGILLFALGPYRPVDELAALGTTSAILIGFLTVIRLPELAGALPPITYLFASTLGLLGLTYASAAYNGWMLRALERWRNWNVNTSDLRIDAVADGISRAVHRDRVSILEGDVLPFFHDLLERADVTEADRARAAAISTAIRTVMVAEADRSWLDELVATFGKTRSMTVDDTHSLASAMGANQRTALRALLVALHDEEHFVNGELRIGSDADRRVNSVAMRVTLTEPAARAALRPYFAVMRIVFPDFRVKPSRSALIIRFSYGHR